METPPHVLVHLGMSGSFLIRGDKGNIKYMQEKRKLKKKQKEEEFEKEEEEAAEEEELWPPRFSKMEIVAENGSEISYADPRRFGKITICQEDPRQHSMVDKLGFDCLYELPGEKGFLELLMNHGRNGSTIKATLLDQSFSAGIGNWVADEVLFDAGIHPGRPVKSLSDEEVEKLRKSIEKIVNAAIEAKSDHRNYPPHWLFHLRWRARGKAKDGVTSDGVRVKVEKIAGRSTVFAPSRQKNRKTKPCSAEDLSAKDGSASEEPEERDTEKEKDEEDLSRSKRTSDAKEEKVLADKSEKSGGDKKVTRRNNRGTKRPQREPDTSVNHEAASASKRTRRSSRLAAKATK